MIIQRFAFWNPGTWQIPKLYWDAFSDEQRIHAICKQLGKVIAYADYLGINVDDIAERLKAIEEGQLDPIIVAAIEQWFEDNQPAIMTALQNLNDALPISDFDSVNTVKAAIDAVGEDITTIEGDIDALEGKFPIQTADIANGAVTTEKIADASIDAAKIKKELISRLSIGSRYIKPTYIGSFTNYSGMHKYLNSADNDVIYAQSMTMADDNEFKFFVVNKNNDNAHIVTANQDTNTVAESQTNHANWGHCNDACYNPDNQRYYICVASDTITTDTILITDSVFTELERVSVPNGFYYAVMLYDKVTKKMYAVCGQDVYDFDPADNSFTEHSQLSELISAGGVALQGGSIYNGVAVFPVAGSNPQIAALKVFDIDTGEKIQTITLAEDDGYYPIGELEDCEFDTNGNLYISSIQCYDTGDRYYSLTVLNKCNIFEGMLNSYFSYYSTQPQNIYVECANYTGFKSDGSSGYPCKSLEEASAMASVFPKIRMIKLGVDSSYSSAVAQVWFGYLQLTGVMCTLHWHGSAVTIRGGIITRDNSIIKIRNAARFLPVYNVSNSTMFRCDDSIVLAGNIYGNADAGASSTFAAVVSCIGCGMFIAQNVVNSVGATAAVSNYNNGFGYVTAPVKSGSW